MQFEKVHWGTLYPSSASLPPHFNNTNSNRIHHIGKAVIREFKSPHLLELCTSKQRPTQLDALTHCQKCLKQFQQPTTLSCGFTLCYQCLPSTEPYQCLSFSCLRSHGNNYRPNVLLESILSQYKSHDPNNQEILKSLLDCSICLTPLAEPITTQCGHTFCKECLIRTMMDSNNRSCPICRHELTRIGKVNQIVCGWLDFLSNGMLYYPDDGQDQIAPNQHMPVIQVTSAVVFPTQHCLIHIADDHRSLLKRMIKNPHQKHYAICVFTKDSPSTEALYDYGVMLHINHVEHSPDIRHSVVQAIGLFRLGINQLTVDEDNCYTGDVIRLDNTEKGKFGMEHQSKNTEVSLTLANTTNDSTSNTYDTSSAPIKRKLTRLRPCSMRFGNSTPNSNRFSMIDSIPASNHRNMWAASMHFSRTSSPPNLYTFTQPAHVPPPNFRHNSDSNITTKIPNHHPCAPQQTPAVLPIAATSNSESIDSLFTQDLHPHLVQYLSNTGGNAWLTQYQLYMQQSDRNSLIWWVANALPLEQEEKLQFLAMQSLRERIMAIISLIDRCK